MTIPYECGSCFHEISGQLMAIDTFIRYVDPRYLDGDMKQLQTACLGSIEKIKAQLEMLRQAILLDQPLLS